MKKKNEQFFGIQKKTADKNFLVSLNSNFYFFFRLKYWNLKKLPWKQCNLISNVHTSRIGLTTEDKSLIAKLILTILKSDGYTSSDNTVDKIFPRIPLSHIFLIFVDWWIVLSSVVAYYVTKTSPWAWYDSSDISCIDFWKK